MKKRFIAPALAVIAASALGAGIFNSKVAAQNRGWGGFQFFPGTLVLSRSVYAGNAGSVTVGETLPPGCAAGRATGAARCGAARPDTRAGAGRRAAPG